MTFTQAEFFLFIGLVLAWVWAVKTLATRNFILLLASYYFYAHWDMRFCALLVFSTLVDHGLAKAIAAVPHGRLRQAYLAVSIATNLGVLAYFKYANFFLDSARQLFDSLGWHSATLDVVLPVGISFFTFQTLSYTIDVYRGKIAATSRLLDFALYVAFFPQLVAGPIVRARELLPQLQTPVRFSRRRCYGGFVQFLRGAAKKILLADRLGEMVDVVFAGPDLYHGLTVGLAVIAYAGQIYYDFSGYSDMAIGVAKMLGYRFPVNFRHPYLASSLAEFWHRWHMTLSRWLRDYVYIPLGGNRHGNLATCRNLMVTMTLGGLWHGAAWTFVLWGMLHGAALIAERQIARWLSRPDGSQSERLRGSLGGRVGDCLGWLGVMLVVLAGWVLFRSPDLATAAQVMRQATTLAEGILWLPPLPLLALVCLVAEHVAWTTRLRLAMRLPAEKWYSPVSVAILLWCLVLYAPSGFRPFVYFQF